VLTAPCPFAAVASDLFGFRFARAWPLPGELLLDAVAVVLADAVAEALQLVIDFPPKVVASVGDADGFR
jgi:hypothetical protein